MTKIPFATYEDLATEYYDSVRHPTCANFREASAYLLSDWIHLLPIDRGLLCEVGPGKSLLAEFLVALSGALNRLVLIDSSPSMLAYSKKWCNAGAHPVLGEAAMIPLVSGSMEFLLSCLGDSYNERHFWQEVYRVLRPGGISVFTTPSYDWALAFRGGNQKEGMTSAEFELSDGRRVRVPSWIYPVDEQLKQIHENGLLVKEVDHVPISAIKSGKLSPKLMVERGKDASIVTGYVIAKS